MTDTFSWKVHASSSGSSEFVVTTSQFGDGYSQDTPQGLNNEMQTWNINVSGYKAQVQPIVDFLRAKKGAESFFWKPPLGVTGYYKASNIRIDPSPGGAYYVISAEFKQVFRP